MATKDSTDMDAKLERLQKRLEMADQRRRAQQGVSPATSPTRPGTARPLGTPASPTSQQQPATRVPISPVSPVTKSPVKSVQVLSSPSKTTTTLSTGNIEVSTRQPRPPSKPRIPELNAVEKLRTISVVADEESDSSEEDMEPPEPLAPVKPIEQSKLDVTSRQEDELLKELSAAAVFDLPPPSPTKKSATLDRKPVDRPDTTTEKPRGTTTTSNATILVKSGTDATKKVSSERKNEFVDEDKLAWKTGISPVFDPTTEAETAQTQTVLDPTRRETDALNGMTKQLFCSSAVPTGKRYQCRIIRVKDTAEKKLYPHYEFYLEHATLGQIFLMSARKRKKSASSNYIISTVKVSTKIKEEIIGKVRSNFLGTEFTLYDNGYNHAKTQDDDGLHEDQPRKELGSVIYDPNILGFKGPRKMTVLCPRMTKANAAVVIQPTRNSDTIVERYKAGNMLDLLALHNKSPQWNEESQSYVLNFSGRVTMASVKNFQIVHDNDIDYIVLQFGRVTDDSFTVDLQYPMSPMQGFSIALTSFDAKLACE